MRPRSILASVIVLATAASSLPAQTNDAATQLVWALDGGGAVPTPVLRVYDPSGAELFVVGALPGSGQARSFSFDKSGFGYLCRGNQVHQLDRSGAPTGVVFNPTGTLANANAITQVPTGEFIVAWGLTTANSGLVRYSPAGAVITTIATGTPVDHPRDLVARPENGLGTVYFANRTNNRIYEFNYLLPITQLQLRADMTTANIGPIGLAWDAAAEQLYIVGDHGQAQVVATMNSSTFAVATSFSYPPSGASGLASAAGCAVDRFRRLYVAGRSANSGTPGVYVFNGSATTPSFLARFPRTGGTPGNIVDVAVQPGQISTCLPALASTNVLVSGQSNRLVLNCPSYANAAYAAALSARWALDCDPYRPGNLAASLTFATPDTRGIPLLDDVILQSTAGVATPASIPPLGGVSLTNLFGAGQGIAITGFVGILDAAGTAQAFVDMTTVPPGAIPSGLQLSFAWLIADTSLPSGVGFISQSECVEIREGVAPTLCP